MKKVHQVLTKSALILSLGFIAGTAFAADGEITFVGKITSATCKINNGQPDFQVTLPTVSVQTLNSAGKTAGRTPFNISLSECDEGLKQVSVYFEPGSYTSMADNRLINSINPNSNVEIQLMNSNLSVIKLSEGVTGQSSQVVPVQNGNASLTYFAEYYATGAAEAGAVQSATEYTIIYP